MPRINLMRRAAAPAAMVALIALAAATACRGSDNTNGPTPAPAASATSEPAGGGPGADRNVSMTFQGRAYQLDQRTLADLLDDSIFTLAGTTNELTIAHDGPVDVFTRPDDAGAVWTRSPAANDTPAQWLRWLPVPSPLATPTPTGERHPQSAPSM